METAAILCMIAIMIERLTKAVETTLYLYYKQRSQSKMEDSMDKAFNALKESLSKGDMKLHEIKFPFENKSKVK